MDNDAARKNKAQTALEIELPVVLKQNETKKNNRDQLAGPCGRALPVPCWLSSWLPRSKSRQACGRNCQQHNAWEPEDSRAVEADGAVGHLVRHQVQRHGRLAADLVVEINACKPQAQGRDQWVCHKGGGIWAISGSNRGNRPSGARGHPCPPTTQTRTQPPPQEAEDIHWPC
jgi:hypothetical protein